MKRKGIPGASPLRPVLSAILALLTTVLLLACCALITVSVGHTEIPSMYQTAACLFISCALVTILRRKKQALMIEILIFVACLLVLLGFAALLWREGDALAALKCAAPAALAGSLIGMLLKLCNNTKKPMRR